MSGAESCWEGPFGRHSLPCPAGRLTRWSLRAWDLQSRQWLSKFGGGLGPIARGDSRIPRSGSRSLGQPLARWPFLLSPFAPRCVMEGAPSPAVLKVQIGTGGRGKAGGVKFANSLAEAKPLIPQLMALTIKGYKVRKVLVGAMSWG